jgi:hypothetical protein
LTLPFFAQKAKNKRRLVATWLGTFGLGMVGEIALSPTNFMRGLSFYSGYGVEGSWLGLLFGNVINYGTQTTWHIGASTVIHLPQPYQILSGALMVIALIGIWESKFELVEKCLLVFAAEICLLWLSAPQFLLNVAVLLPIASRVKLSLRSVGLWWLTGLFAFFPFITYWAERTTFTVAFYFQIVVEGLLALFVLIELRSQSRNPHRNLDVQTLPSDHRV